MWDKSVQEKSALKSPEQDKQLALEYAGVMRKGFIHKPSQTSKSKVTVATEQADEYIFGAFNTANSLGSNFSKLAVDQQWFKAAAPVSSGFGVTSFILALLDFGRIPFIFFISWAIDKKPPPIKLSRTAKWLYSGLVLALTLTAFFVPGAATAIGLTLASLGIATSLFGLVKHAIDYFYLKHQIRAQEEKIKSLTAELEHLRALASKVIPFLHNQNKEKFNELLQEAENLKLIDNRTQFLNADDKAACELMWLIKSRFENTSDALKASADKLYQLEKRLDKISWRSALTRMVSVALTSVALVGLIVSLYYPPIGLGIMTGAAIVGGVFFAAKVAYAVVERYLPGKKSAGLLEVGVPEWKDNSLNLGQKLGEQKTPTYNGGYNMMINVMGSNLDADAGQNLGPRQQQSPLNRAIPIQRSDDSLQQKVNLQNS